MPGAQLTGPRTGSQGKSEREPGGLCALDLLLSLGFCTGWRLQRHKIETLDA